MSGKRYRLFMLYAAGLLLFIASIHRMVLPYHNVYVNRIFALSVVILCSVFIVLTVLYIPALIFFSIKDKKLTSVIYNILLLILYVVILVLSMFIDAPTLVYAT